MWCGAAHAQEQAQPAQATAAYADDNQVQEVVVTAERRTTNLQTTPVAATVLSGADLDKKGVNAVDQLQFVSPSVTLQNYGQGNSFNIRGIGKSETNSTVTVGVITYRDGVATFPGYFQSEPYYDLASVEILRGPQGTFAGQNATGGAVVITEQNPIFNRTGGFLEGSYGNYNNARMRGAVNLPISDTFAARVAFNSEYRDSFHTITGPYSGDPGRLQSNSVRLSLLWQPTDALTVSFKTDYNYINMGGYPADPVTAKNDRFHITNNAYNSAVDEFSRTVLNVNYKFANGLTLRSVTGYQKGNTSEDIDSDGTSLLSNTFTDSVGSEIISQEFNLISPDTDRFKWLVGAYFQRNHMSFPHGTFITHTPAYDITLEGTNNQNTAAVFGQVSYSLTPALELQVGARYSNSKSDNDGLSTIPQLGVYLAQKDSQSDDKVTGKIALNWTMNDRNFIYGFVATGHKAGGLNGVNLTPLAPRKIDPEDVTDLELGWKAKWFDGHLRTQVGGYYNIYKNFQVTIADPAQPGLNSILNVASDTTLMGLEASGQAVFGPLSFDFGGSVSHSELGKFFAKDARVGATAPCNATTGPVGGGCTELTGNAQTYAPSLSFNGGVQYVFSVWNGATLTPRVDYAHIGGAWATLFQNRLLGDRLSPRDIVNMQLIYERDSWRLTAYATNLTDLSYTSGINSGRRVAGAPRQYGVRLRKDF
jgi:iron complex outermembrane receptor protein